MENGQIVFVSFACVCVRVCVCVCEKCLYLKHWKLQWLSSWPNARWSLSILFSSVWIPMANGKSTEVNIRALQPPALCGQIPIRSGIHWIHLDPSSTTWFTPYLHPCHCHKNWNWVKIHWAQAHVSQLALCLCPLPPCPVLWRDMTTAAPPALPPASSPLGMWGRMLTAGGWHCFCRVWIEHYT